MYGALGIQAAVRQWILVDRKRSTSRKHGDDRLAPEHPRPWRYNLGAWLANASATEIRELAKWVERFPPGQVPTATDPLALALLRLPLRFIRDQNGDVRRYHRGSLPEGPFEFCGLWLLAKWPDQEILARLDEELGMAKVSSEALRAALKSLGVPRPPRRRNADGTLQ